MIPEIGQFVLLLALLVAGVQSFIPLIGASKKNTALMKTGSSMALTQFFLILIAFFTLTYAFVASDFSVYLVFKNSHSLKPMIYKISGVWGNHEGSMLLWVLILALFGAAVAVFANNLPSTLKARVLSIQAMIGCCFMSFIVFTSNPFDRLDPPPLNGLGLNPILQDPGLAFHPPLLYLGYVGFSVTFSFAIAGLLEEEVDGSWGKWVRPWVIAAWTSLTAGIILGSWWAYYELGWGGWWFWDPVENASFMPWLFGTALLHSVIVIEKRNTLKIWALLLAILTFFLCLLGTFLVRSGVLTSVHAFASDPERGIFILTILLFAVGGALLLFALKAPRITSHVSFSFFSRESAIILNNLILTFASVTILLGTLYPLILEAITGGTNRVSVGPPYFNLTFVPIMIPLLIAISFGPLLAWKNDRLAVIANKLKFAFISALVAAIITYIKVPDGPILAPIAIGLAIWVAAGSLTEWAMRAKLFDKPFDITNLKFSYFVRALSGMTLAHLGLSVLIIGITGSSAWQNELITSLSVGESKQFKEYTITLEKIEYLSGPNYKVERGHLLITKPNGGTLNFKPEKRFFPLSGQTTTEASIKTTLLTDLYAVLGESKNHRKSGKKWTLRFFINPLVPWIWIGAVLMVFGGLVSLMNPRHWIAGNNSSK
ncbi:MAG: heme lyase NrfEFG subunit NrfE [Alphaproteobacteria bacterium]|nr:heme lyase NrfEFG subunit NrfE [Alphaproteobacteria bacterium]PPR13938.1 MAG: Cytochrome c-type biogenesis protein CcmF [Alphaproteobacteria bacterium MarineAlpha12_Bin1]